MVNTVSLFLGSFKNKSELDRYTKEIYSDDGDVSSEFMQAFKIDFIDNQFREVFFLETNNLKDLIEPLSYSADFLEEINFARKANGVIALYDFKYTGSVQTDGRMTYIGYYKYSEE
jgi:hypothetical protein